MSDFVYDDKENGKGINSIILLDSKPGEKSSSDRFNKIRENLVIFLSKISSDHPYLIDNRWKNYYEQINAIKRYFITNFGEDITSEIRIEGMGGMNYSYDFGVKFIKEDGTLFKIMALEYKHQAGWEKLPQFYQFPVAKTNILSASMPTFSRFLFDTGIVSKQIELLNSIINFVPEEIKNEYGFKIEPLEYNKWLTCVSRIESPGLNDFDKVDFWKRIDKNTNLFFRVGRHLIKCDCTDSYCNPTGTCSEEMYKKADAFRRISKLGIHNFLCEFKDKVTSSDLTNLEDKIRTKQGTKELNTIEVGKGKTYMFIDKNNRWFLEPSPDVWEIDKDTSKIQIWGTSGTKNFVSNIDIPLISGNKLTCKLRWQNVEGIFNPSLQVSAELTESHRKFMFDNKFPNEAEDIIPKKSKPQKRVGCENEIPSTEAPLTTTKQPKTKNVSAKAAPTGNVSNISKLSKTELIEICKSKKLTISGNKNDLCNRINQSVVTDIPMEKISAEEATISAKKGSGTKKNDTSGKRKTKKNIGGAKKYKEHEQQFLNDKMKKALEQREKNKRSHFVKFEEAEHPKYGTPAFVYTDPDGVKEIQTKYKQDIDNAGEEMDRENDNVFFGGKK